MSGTRGWLWKLTPPQSGGRQGEGGRSRAEGEGGRGRGSDSRKSWKRNCGRTEEEESIRGGKEVGEVAKLGEEGEPEKGGMRKEGGTGKGRRSDIGRGGKRRGVRREEGREMMGHLADVIFPCHPSAGNSATLQSH